MSAKHILSGYKVLDFTHVLAGPSATRMLVEMGAEVIKVEFPPLGDVSRSLPVQKNGRSTYHVQQNRGKKSICINLKTPQGKALIESLIKAVDIVVENFSPGVAARLGIGWDTVRTLNPRAVMCSISAFGQNGPLSELPGFDYIAQAYAGVTGMIGEPNEAPVLPMLGLGDVNTGVHAACAIGYALLARERTGVGDYLDISLLDAYVHCHEINISVYATTGKSPQRSGHFHYAVCPLGLFKCGDRYVCIITLDPQWPALCKAMGRPALSDDPRYSANAKRVERAPEVNELVQHWVDSIGDIDKVVARLNEAHVPCAPVLTIEEMVNHPHMRLRGTVREVQDAKIGNVTVPGMPLRFSGHPHNIDLAAAHLGENNQEILSSVLGLNGEQIAALEQQGILYANPGT